MILKGYTLKGKNLLPWEQFIPFRICPCLEGRETNFDILVRVQNQYGKYGSNSLLLSS